MDGNRRQDSDTALMSQMMSILSQLTLDVTQMKSDIHQQDLEMSSYAEQSRSSDPSLMHFLESGHCYHTEVTDSSLTTSPLLTSQDSTIFGSSSLLTETNTRNQENSEQLDGIENQEENVEEQQTDFQSMIEKLKTENESLICENILLKADHKLLGVKHTILSSKFKSLNNTNESLKFENEALISKNSQLERENEEHTCINESQKCVNEGLTSEILKLQNANKNLKLETDALNNQNNACTSANKTLTDGKIHAEAEIENLRATINQLEDKIRAVDTENEVLKKDKQQLSNQKAKLIEQANSRIEQANSQIEQANSRIKEILKEKEEIQGKADELKNKYKELESTVNSLEMKASRADTGREESRYETEQLRSELVRLKGDSTLSDCFSPLYEQRCKIIEQSIKGLVGKQFDNPDLKPLSRYTLTLYDRDKMFERYPNLKLISDVYYDIYDKMKDYLQELILDRFDPRLNNSYKYHREDLNHRKTFNIFFPCDNVKQTLECLIVMQNNLLRTQLVYDEWNEMANFPFEPLYEEGIYSVKSLTDLDPWVCHIMSYFISNVVSVFLDHHQF